MLATELPEGGNPADAASRLRSVSSIGVLREGLLHAAVNAMLAAPRDRMEAPVGLLEVAVCRGLRSWRLTFSTRSRDFTSEVWAERARSRDSWDVTTDVVGATHRSMDRRPLLLDPLPDVRVVDRNAEV